MSAVFNEEQQDLFDEGEALKAEGIQRAASRSKYFLELVRNKARNIVEEHGAVTIVELRHWANKHDIQPEHPNAWGAVFKEKGWVPVGFTRSTVASAHSRMVRMWVWQGG